VDLFFCVEFVDHHMTEMAQPVCAVVI